MTIDEVIISLKDCSNETDKQIAEWLEAYKKLLQEVEQDIYERAYKEGYNKGYSDGNFIGSNKAIDDFVDKLKPKLNEKIKGWTNSDDLIRWCNNSVDEIAEQLKAGGDNEC